VDCHDVFAVFHARLGWRRKLPPVLETVLEFGRDLLGLVRAGTGELDYAAIVAGSARWAT
jgi:hypothetical protein